MFVFVYLLAAGTLPADKAIGITDLRKAPVAAVAAAAVAVAVKDTMAIRVARSAVVQEARPTEMYLNLQHSSPVLVDFCFLWVRGCMCAGQHR